MLRLITCIAGFGFWLAVLAADVGADGLRVAPTGLDISAPQAAAALTVENMGRAPSTVQARVFRWSQSGGRERFEPTRDVVVSPPMSRVPPRGRLTVRVIRVSKAPLREEEAYRVFIDEVPDRARQAPGTVNFVTRLRLPVFFSPVAAEPARVTWRMVRADGALAIEARNSGGRRLRLADVSLSQGGRVIHRQPGLFGYVLPNGTMRWPLAGGAGGANIIQAQTNLGPYRAAIGGP